MLTKLAAAERLIPQKKVTGDPNAVRRAVKAKQKQRAAKKARRKQAPSLVFARRNEPAVVPQPKPAPVVYVLLHPKDDLARFENSRYYKGYARRTCAGESCHGTY